MSVMPPQKRERKDSNGDARTRSKYWFRDGNVILQAEDTLFRVHQSMLSRYSQIFEDTFAIPQPPSQEDEFIDDCPVVVLSDTAKDLDCLISELYDSDRRRNSCQPKFIGSMLRLGRKYGIVHIENLALRTMDASLPTTLQGWDSVQIMSPKGIAQLIAIVHEFGLFTKLPAAYALYIRSASLDTLHEDPNLPEEARKHCMTGYVKIMAYIKNSYADASCPPFLPSKGCTSMMCMVDRWEIIKNLPVWAIEDDESFGIFDSWKLRGVKATEQLCSGCRVEAKNMTNKVRKKFWAVLPTLFGLPSWTDLKDGF